MSEKIVICNKCNGEGLIHCSELTDYHNGYYDHWTKKCDRCKGSGRLWEVIETTRTAYKQKKVEKKR